MRRGNRKALSVSCVRAVASAEAQTSERAGVGANVGSRWLALRGLVSRESHTSTSICIPRLTIGTCVCCALSVLLIHLRLFQSTLTSSIAGQANGPATFARHVVEEVGYEWRVQCCCNIADSHEAQLMETIKHYSSFPATGVSLRQMVQFGSNPSTGMTSSHRTPMGTH